MEETTAPIRALSYEGEYRAWLARCPVDPAEGQERLPDAYAGLLDPKLQHLQDHALRALVFSRLRQGVLDQLRAGSGVDRAAIERTLPKIPKRFPRPDAAREMQESLERQAAAIKTLSDQCQEIFALWQFEQMTVSEIAARLKMEEAEVERELVMAVCACAAVTFSAPMPIRMHGPAASAPITAQRRPPRLRRRPAMA
jgi:RNA polymerase sigma factor (sigma-70 family)